MTTAEPAEVRVDRPVRPLDYEAAIAHCFNTLGHAQGSKGCVAFARGAEWAREPLISEIERLRALLKECEPAVYSQHMREIGSRIAKPGTLLARVREA